MSPWEVDPVAVAAGDLSPPERAAADRLLGEDPAYRAEVDRAARVAGALSALPAEAWTASAPPPPPLDLPRALAARPAAAEPAEPGAAPAPALAPAQEPLGVPAQPAPHEGRRRGPGRRSGARSRRAPRVLVLRPLSAALASLALLAAGAGGAVLLASGGDAARDTAAQQPPSPAREVVLEPLEPVAAGTERARVALPARAGGTVRVALDGIAPLPRGEYLELWLLREGADMVSLGTFRAGADGRVRVTLPLGVDPAGVRFVDVSVERDDGDPTHSQRSVLRSAALS